MCVNVAFMPSVPKLNCPGFSEWVVLHASRQARGRRLLRLRENSKELFYHSGLAHTGEAFSQSQCHIPSNIQSSEERTSRFADHPACRSAGYKHVREQAQNLEMFRGRRAAASPHGHDDASHHPVCQRRASRSSTTAITIVTGRHREIHFLAGRPVSCPAGLGFCQLCPQELSGDNAVALVRDIHDGCQQPPVMGFGKRRQSVGRTSQKDFPMV